jgi:hypothetical protein
MGCIFYGQCGTLLKGMFRGELNHLERSSPTCPFLITILLASKFSK